MALQTYLINLKHSEDRLKVMDGFLNHFGIQYERVEAVDAQTLSEEVYETVTAPNIEYPHHLRPGEVACFMSHRACWQKLVDSDNDWALIFEDHCDFSTLADRYLKSTDWIPQECELIQLNYSNRPIYSNRQIKLQDGNVLACLSCSSPVGTSAYFISRKAAKIALEESQTIDSPVDNFLFGAWSNYSPKIPCWRMLGSVVKRAENTVTTISGRGNKNRVRNIERLHPKRLIRKLEMKIHRAFLKKIYQYWLCD